MQQRFLQITDKLCQKGYNIYPFDDHNHAFVSTYYSFVWGTSKHSQHKQRYLIVIPHKGFNNKDIEILGSIPHKDLVLYDIEPDYVVYQRSEKVNVSYAEKLIQSYLRESTKAPHPKTENKKFSFNKKRIHNRRMTTQEGETPLERAKKIRDQLYFKGYKPTHYSQEEEIKKCEKFAALFATHETSMHQNHLFIVIPNISLSESLQKVIQKTCSQNAITQLYEIDRKYLAFYYNNQLTFEMIDHLLGLKEGLYFETDKKKLKTVTQEIDTKQRTTISSDLKTGQEVEGYVILKLLGEGGFGKAYLVERHNAFYVLKIARDTNSTHSIENETRVLENLNSMMKNPEYEKIPNCVPKIFKYGLFGNLPYFIEEYIITVDLLTQSIYKDSRVQKCNVLELVKNYYLEQAKLVKKYEREKYLDYVNVADNLLSYSPIPIDPLVASHLIWQLSFLIYVMNLNNYHYGDLKCENIGLRLDNMDIFDRRRINERDPIHCAIKREIIAEQLVVSSEKPLKFCAVLLDFGSVGLYNRDGDDELFFTPRYMVPNEIIVKDGKVKKNFVKDPYSLGLVFFNMVAGLEPFWNINLIGSGDQQMEIIKNLYHSNVAPFDIHLVRSIISHNMTDIRLSGRPQKSLNDFICEYALALMGGVFKEQMASLITNMRKVLSEYHHESKSRYRALIKGSRVSEFDEVTDAFERGLFSRKS